MRLDNSIATHGLQICLKLEEVYLSHHLPESDVRGGEGVLDGESRAVERERIVKGFHHSPLIELGHPECLPGGGA